MADTGWLNPSATGTTYNEWTNPSRCYASDNSYASSRNRAGSANQDFYNFGVSIPAGSTIDGIIVSIEGKNYSKKQPNFRVRLSYDAGSNYTGTKDTGAYSSESYKEVGGSADAWSRTWAVGDFSNANFRVHINNVGDNAVATYENCDHVRVKIYYTEGGVTVTAKIASCISSTVSPTVVKGSISIQDKVGSAISGVVLGEYVEHSEDSVILIDLSTGGVEFSADEIIDVILKGGPEIVEDITKGGKYFYTRKSVDKMEMQVTFDLIDTTVLEKVESVFEAVDEYGNPEKFKIYYRLKWDTKAYWCSLTRNSFKKSYKRALRISAPATLNFTVIDEV